MPDKLLSRVRDAILQIFDGWINFEQWTIEWLRRFGICNGVNLYRKENRHCQSITGSHLFFNEQYGTVNKAQPKIELEDSYRWSAFKVAEFPLAGRWQNLPGLLLSTIWESNVRSSKSIWVVYARHARRRLWEDWWQQKDLYNHLPNGEIEWERNKELELTPTHGHWIWTHDSCSWLSKSLNNAVVQVAAA